MPCAAKPLVSSAVLVGIPSFRRPEGITKLLNALAQQTRLDDVQVTVFVADNDPSLQQAKHACGQMVSGFRWPLRCEVVEEPGVAATRNRILHQARETGADYVAMLDDDEAPAPEWLHELLAMQRKTNADAVGGAVRYRFAVEPSAAVRRWGYFNPKPAAPGLSGSLTGAGNLLLSCAALERLGWPMFDVRFGASGGEDAEFFVRVAKRGFRFAWAPDAIVYEEVTPDRIREKALLSRAFRTGNNEVRIRRVNGQGGMIVKMVAKSAALLLAAPLLVPILATPSRLWLLSKWAAAIGRMSALTGSTAFFYGATEAARK